MKNTNNKTIAIIGGGYSGLSAAHVLIKQGYHVEIYEAAPFLGGLASTFSIGEAQVEKFYHHLFLSDNYLIELLNEFKQKLDNYLLSEKVLKEGQILEPLSSIIRLSIN